MKSTRNLISLLSALGALVFGLPALAAAPAPPSQATLAALGKQMFVDPALSASGTVSCASCHAPQNAGLAPNTLPVQPGGANSSTQGFRNAPTTTYALFTPPPATSIDGRLHGGQMLDGRAADLAAQAVQPFLSSVEMANASSADVRARLQKRPYLQQFEAAFGAAILNNADATLNAMARAIAAFERSDPSFQLFSSKFDAYLKGKAKLTAQEANGLSLFNNAQKGNCSACHVSTSIVSGVPPLFTNFSYHTLGVPRNWKIAYNQDSFVAPAFVPQNGYGLGAPNHKYYDLGACGPFRADLGGVSTACGQFKVPTLRNTALKGAYEHNGVFASLQQVLAFYNTRDLNPGAIYKQADGVTADIVYNDLPVIYHANVEDPPPFRPLPGKLARLQPSEVQDIIAFLCTLTDGYDPANPARYRYPAQCKAALR